MAPTKPRVRQGVELCEIDGEIVAYERSGPLHHLNHTASIILDLCDGNATIAQMASEIAAVYEMDVAEVEKLVRATIRQLRKADLLQPTKAKRDVDVAVHEHHHADDRGRIRTVVPRSP